MEANVQMQSSTQGANRSPWKTLRRLFDTSLPLVGVETIVIAILFVTDVYVQVALAITGILVIEASVWKVAHKLLPSERKYKSLRVEGDQFLGLIRRLHHAALALRTDDKPENRQAFEEIQETMRQAIERMAQIAGKTDAEVAAEQEVSV